MPTVYVSMKPSANGKSPSNLIHAPIGKETITLVPVEIGNEKLNCIQAAQKDQSSYYILGYYSSNDALDGRFRRIKVRMADAKLQAKLRRSFSKENRAKPSC